MLETQNPGSPQGNRKDKERNPRENAIGHQIEFRELDEKEESERDEPRVQSVRWEQ